MKKQYRLQYNFSAEMVIEVDHAIMTPEVFKEYSEFWSNKPDLEDWLVSIYMIALRQSVAALSATASLMKGEEEGFPKMDGSAGVKIVSFDEFSFDEFDVDFMEIK